MALTFTRPGGGGLAGTVATGTTRWNQTNNMLEVFDSYQWTAIVPEEAQHVTIADMVQYAEDRVATMIDEEYPDNATIQDAYKVWEEANERFKIILALAENK